MKVRFYFYEHGYYEIISIAVDTCIEGEVSFYMTVFGLTLRVIM